MPAHPAWRWSTLPCAIPVLMLALAAHPTSVAACEDDEDQPVETETFAETLTFPDGGTLRLSSFSGSVTIRGGTRSDLAVTGVRRASRERLDRIKLSMESTSSGVRIDANRHDDDCRSNNVVETDFEIEIPATGAVDVSVFSSPVTVEGVTGALKVHSFSAGLELSDVSAPLDAKTFSGGINVRVTDATTAPELRLESFSGRITVRVPPAAQAAVEFDSFSGELESDHPLVFTRRSGRRLEASLNAPDDGALANHIRVKTFSGGAALR